MLGMERLKMFEVENGRPPNQHPAINRKQSTGNGALKQGYLLLIIVKRLPTALVSNLLNYPLL